MLKNVPKRIYLQIGEDCDCKDWKDVYPSHEVTWCQDKINDNDICYVRVANLATIPKLYKHPYCNKTDGDRICNVFYDDTPGHVAFVIHGDHADIVAQAIIEMQGQQ